MALLLPCFFLTEPRQPAWGKMLHVLHSSTLRYERDLHKYCLGHNIGGIRWLQFVSTNITPVYTVYRWIPKFYPHISVYQIHARIYISVGNNNIHVRQASIFFGLSSGIAMWSNETRGSGIQTQQTVTTIATLLLFSFPHVLTRCRPH